MCSATPQQERLAGVIRQLYPEQAGEAKPDPALWAPLGEEPGLPSVTVSCPPCTPHPTKPSVWSRWLGSRLTGQLGAQLGWGLAACQAMAIMLLLLLPRTTPMFQDAAQGPPTDSDAPPEQADWSIYRTMWSETEPDNNLFRLDIKRSFPGGSHTGKDEVMVGADEEVEVLAVSRGVSEGFLLLLRVVPGIQVAVAYPHAGTEMDFVTGLHQGEPVFSERMGPELECVQYHAFLAVRPLRMRELPSALWEPAGTCDRMEALPPLLGIQTASVQVSRADK